MRGRHSSMQPHGGYAMARARERRACYNFCWKFFREEFSFAALRIQMREVRPRLRKNRTRLGIHHEEMPEVRRQGRTSARRACHSVQRLRLVRDRLRRKGRASSGEKRSGRRRGRSEGGRNIRRIEARGGKRRGEKEEISSSSSV